MNGLSSAKALYACMLVALPCIFMPITSQANENGTVELTPVQNEQQKTQNALDALNTKIKQAKASLKQLNAKASKTQRQLGEAQRALSQNERQKRALVAGLKEVNAKILSTQEHIITTKEALIQHKKWIEEQLQRQYRQEDTALKLVLSGESPSDTARLIRYHQHIHQTRSNKMDEIKREQAELAALRLQQIDSKQSLKEKEKALLKVEKANKALRERLLASQKKAQQSIAAQQQDVNSMQTRSTMLEEMLQALIIQEELAQANKNQAFAQLKGKLPKPLIGTVQNLFNTQNSSNDTHRRGTWITPKSDSEEVKSIAPGHVVYADWLLGYGLLTIIDHGDGYFTLYGHSETLLRSPGDYIDAGTPIALVSEQHSMGIKGLYFEIRKNSQALNPMSWLKKH